MSFEIDFSGKVVLITGATRGIGAALARDFCAAGADLILTGTNSQQINELNRNNADAGVTNMRYVQADFSDEISLQSFLDDIARYKRIDVCINNAGTNRIDFIDSTKVEDFELLMQVNLRAPFLISRQVSRLMKRASYGRIVNIASIWSVITKVSPGFTMTELTKSTLSENEIQELSSQVPMQRFAQPEEISKVVLFLCSDLNTYITGQNIVADGGFVSV
jgi:3-oxoacyl-[acyl-carrier protein] reductase